jgi:hypothetical protein
MRYPACEKAEMVKQSRLAAKRTLDKLRYREGGSVSLRCAPPCGIELLDLAFPNQGKSDSLKSSFDRLHPRFRIVDPKPNQSVERKVQLQTRREPLLQRIEKKRL